ncbi:P-loop containing nucleoside triphosphate hydrolase protein, partial [Lentinula detonsa]
MLRLFTRPHTSSYSLLRTTVTPMSHRHKRSKIQPSASTATLSTATPSTSRPPSSLGDRGHFSDRKFQDLPISLKLKQNIKHEFLTEVQAATIEPALNGKDILVQAKTGTGKTIGFLLPAIEKALRSPVRPKGTPILVLSPTRELAQQVSPMLLSLPLKLSRYQISTEAQTLLPQSDLRIITVTGGTRNPSTDLQKFLERDHDIVVATPGRLHDYFTGPRKTEAYEKFHGLQTLVLDEVDRLLDGGFARELDGVISMLPKTKRQNLFFSATISNNIKQVAKKYNDGSEYTFISTLKEDEMNVHQHVHQSYIITPFEKHIPTLLALLHLDSIKHPLPHTLSKVMVFFPTARHVSFAMEVLSSESIKKSLPPLLEIHSRKSQSARTKAAEAFKNAKSAILLSSDVAARGIDFPGVTLVIQVGIPSSAEQYVHRLGRTARAGAKGQGIIILDPQEQPFHTTREMQKTTTISPYISSPSSHEAKELETYIQTYAQHVQNTLETVSTNNPTVIGSAYVSFLGYYKGQARMMKWSSERLVEEANRYAKQVMGWTDALPPAISPKAVGMMGLKGVRGLNIMK